MDGSQRWWTPGLDRPQGRLYGHVQPSESLTACRPWRRRDCPSDGVPLAHSRKMGAARRTATARRDGAEAKHTKRFPRTSCPTLGRGLHVRARAVEIRQLGYTGSLSHLGRLLAGWRRAGRPVTVDAITTATTLLFDPLTGHLVSPIVAAALCVKPRGLLTDAQAAKVDAFKAISPAFATMRALAMRFRGILRGGDVEKLTAWLHDADHSALYGIRRFVHTLRQDLAAVRNAITETWSNGQTESQINRLKMLKRAMYGRAGIDLLRARMIPLSPIQNHTK